ncbi:unnamed protein product [Toxocara canis]|uniref:Sodium/nucleoside cotransporter n=2 Tax=Toxocara canis TaxID=6265 RepID=A0A183V8H8_TOXCA|nr:unnamed protein product [Toxocara canis]
MFDVHILGELSSRWFRTCSKLLSITCYSLLFIILNLLLIFSLIHNFNNAIALLVIVIICWLAILLHLVNRFIPQSFWHEITQVLQKLYSRRLRLLISASVGAALFAYVLYLCILNTVQLISLAGLLVLIVVSVLISKDPARIKWSPVLWGIFLQYVAGFVVLKWTVGQIAFQWATEKFVAFLSYTSNGTTFVFGFVPNPPNICGIEAPFSFTSLPIIIFFSSLCSVFYYLGIVQWFLLKIATFLQYSMGTTAAESLNAAASIFLGPTEAAVMMRQSLRSMTESEIMATMTAGFAMISGSLFALYIAFGACPSHLLASNLMSAPAVLAVSKIVQPEVQRSKQKHIKDFQFPPSEESSLLESISAGAVQAVSVIFAIISNLIVFLALVTFFDTSVGFFARLIGYEGVTFNMLLGYMFFPLAYVMGVSDASESQRRTEETLRVAQLIGTKTLLNEFIAYQQMSEMLRRGELGSRAQMMAVFACCGYSNASQIGSQLGIFGSMAPSKRRSFAKAAVRSLIAGSIACFMTAVVAGNVLMMSSISSHTLKCFQNLNQVQLDV